jgi:hypothetical protein
VERIRVCDECGVPLMVSGELSWDDNGVISSKSSPKNRWVFYESENIDPLFKGIEELIGMPIEHIVIESRRRETKKYIERAFPPEVRGQLSFGGEAGEEGGLPLTEEERETGRAISKTLTQSVMDVGRVYGYGDQWPGDHWEGDDEHPWRRGFVRNPYSLLLIAADTLGSVEAFEGTDMQAKYELTADDTYMLTAYPGEHPLELKGRLTRIRYGFKSGDIHYERCSVCGVPEIVGRYIWDLEEGIIIDPDTGRRMAIFGPHSIDSIFNDLESELGEAIPEMVIEAQRRYIKSAWSADDWRRRAPDFQRLLALRGLGNLVDFEGDREHLTVTLQNSCLHLPMVGIVQALVEMAYRVEESTYEWDFAEDGNLTVNVNILR